MLSQEHLMIRDAVRDFAERELRPQADRIDKESRFPREIIRKMGELGFLGIPYEERWGGSGGDNLSYMLAVEEIGRVCGSTGLTLAAHVSLGTYPIWRYGTQEQKEAYLPHLVRGEYMGAFGLTEPNAGSDAGGTQSRAVRHGDSYVINGTKIWMTNGDEAGVVIMTARTSPEEEGTGGISAFLVERGNPGMRVAKHESKLGCRGSTTVEMIFEDCRVPAGRRLGEEGNGFRMFMDTLDGGRISIGALALGIAQGAFEAAVRYAQERVQFGRPISKFQGVQWILADMQTRIHGSRLMVYHAARLKDAGERHKKEAAMAKLFASETGMWVTTKAIQIFGGMGYSTEAPVERYFRDAKLMEIGEGTSEIQRNLIAREVLKELETS